MSSNMVNLLKAAEKRGYVIVLPGPPARISPHAIRIANYCLRLGLSRAEARVLAKLMDRDIATREELHIAVSGHAMTRRKIVTVMVNRLRQKLAAHGIEIAAFYGFGYQLASASRKKVQKLLTEHAAAPSRTGAQEEA
jgi:DNA-binding winged helix-turn-helix (wHTH) protein